MPHILLLGDPRLRLVSTPVTNFASAEFARELQLVAGALGSFRRTNGFGRATAAPQVGIHKRFIAFDRGGGEGFIVNPEITWRSKEIITMWDDCMSIPGLLVKVPRHASISLTFRDETGTAKTWNHLDTDLSELIQHEVDHLDGILATDRALDKESLILREQFLVDPKFYSAQVDYVISSYRDSCKSS